MQPSFILKSSVLRLLLCLSAAIFLAACQPPEAMREVEVRVVPPIAGQVFVVVPSGESLRLGSVRVQIFDGEAIEAHLHEAEQKISARREELRDQLSELEGAALAKAEAKARFEQAYNSREAEVRLELASYVEKARERAARLQGQIEANTAFIQFKDAIPPPPVGIPSREEYEEYEKRRKKWLSMTRSERTAWVEVLTSHNLELKTEIENIGAARDEKVFAFADELQVLDREIEKSRKAVAAAMEAVELVKKERNEWPKHSDYLTGLPPPLHELRTDADGEFSINLPPDRNYIVFAQADRRLGGEKMEMKWFVRAGENRLSRVLLSNHNTISTRAPENVIVLSSTSDDSNI